MRKSNVDIVEEYFNVLKNEIKKNVKIRSEFVIVENGRSIPLKIENEDNNIIFKDTYKNVIKDLDLKNYLLETVFNNYYILFSFVNYTDSFYMDNLRYYEMFSFIIEIIDEKPVVKYTNVEAIKDIYRNEVLPKGFPIEREQIIYKDDKNVLMEIFEE